MENKNLTDHQASGQIIDRIPLGMANDIAIFGFKILTGNIVVDFGENSIITPSQVRKCFGECDINILTPSINYDVFEARQITDPIFIRKCRISI